MRSADSAPSLAATYGVLLYLGFALELNGMAAPGVAITFGLDQAAVARLFAAVSLSALGSLALARLADSMGRRRVLLGCAAATAAAGGLAAGATTVIAFAVWEGVLLACTGAGIAVAQTLVAELLPAGERARGQSRAGVAAALGAGACILAIPLVTLAGGTWRTAFALTGVAGAVGWLVVWRTVPEPEAWTAWRGSVAPRAAASVFDEIHRRRTLPLLLTYFTSYAVAASVTGWGYYHAVVVVGLSGLAGSVTLLAGGAVGLLGFPLGAWGSDHLGRVPTVVVFGVVAAAGELAFFWGPPATVAPVPWLAAAFAVLVLFGNASLVGLRTATVELFPTELRATIAGWNLIARAVAVVATQATIAALLPVLGSASIAVGWLGLLAPLGALVFAASVQETREWPATVKP